MSAIVLKPQKDITAYESALIVGVNNIYKQHGYTLAKEVIEKYEMERHFVFKEKSKVTSKLKWPWSK